MHTPIILLRAHGAGAPTSDLPCVNSKIETLKVWGKKPRPPRSWMAGMMAFFFSGKIAYVAQNLPSFLIMDDKVQGGCKVDCSLYVCTCTVLSRSVRGTACSH